MPVDKMTTSQKQDITATRSPQIQNKTLIIRLTKGHGTSAAIVESSLGAHPHFLPTLWSTQTPDPIHATTVESDSTRSQTWRSTPMCIQVNNTKYANILFIFSLFYSSLALMKES